MPPQNQNPQNQPPEYRPPEYQSGQPPTQGYGIPAQEPLRTPPAAAAGPQPEVSRRSLLRSGLLGGGIGLAVAAGAGTAVGLTHHSSGTSLKPASKPVVMAPMPPRAVQGPLVVYISDSASGVLDVFAGTGATRIHNPGLVTQLLDNLK
ncbi:hypothetical protein [Actinacidiphila epipremni]|jgi:hypothetical protein|uniref:Uncharacterized protein n=1 Tax=Actinacidiphila epipremni TaxID=2053013 RepID=A0ABX0ZHQ1_9ACTN|nr:hypothetical protein [Actinacidiphila epipremni]NJP43270.1 hypothetical protein [Actinacidiphila epipremni]